MKKIHILCLSLIVFLLANNVLARIVVIVNRGSTIDTLSNIQASNIFLVKTYTFPDGDKATPVDISKGNTIRDEFYEKVSKKDSYQLQSYWSRLIFTGKKLPPTELSTEEEVKNYVAKTPGAIGYINKELVDNSVKVVLELE